MHSRGVTARRSDAGHSGRLGFAATPHPMPMSGRGEWAKRPSSTCDDRPVTDDLITPEQLSHGRIVRDEDLPELAAQWLVAGYDSPALRELAGLTRRDAMEASQLVPEVLAELGHPIVASDFPYEYLPWRGHWEGIWWAVDQMDKTHSPYASAQYVLEIFGDVPGLWEPGRGDELMRLLRDWDENRDERRAIGDKIRDHLRSLRETDVLPLSSGS
jgi:hypothetical protein